MCLWVWIIVHCFVMQFLHSLYVCVGVDDSSLVVMQFLHSLYVFVGGDDSSLFCDAVFALIVFVCGCG